MTATKKGNVIKGPEKIEMMWVNVEWGGGDHSGCPHWESDSEKLASIVCSGPSTERTL